MKRLAIAVALSASLNAFADEPVDLSTYWPETPTAEQTLPEGNYTLSADYTLPVALLMKQGSTFDFPAGKTFSPAGGVTLSNPFIGKTTLLRGGTWNFAGTSMAFDYSGTRVDNYSFIVDGAAVTNVSSIFLIPTGIGGAASFALTNGAALKLKSSQYSELCRLRKTDDPFVFDISTGSTLESTAPIYFAYTGGGDPDIRQNCTLRVRGAGSKLATTSQLVIGQYSPGYTLDVSDGGSVNPSTFQMGRGGYSHDNTVIVRGAGSSFTSTTPEIGEQSSDAAHYGATSNNWVRVLDGATATLSTNYQRDCPVGPYSANNGIYVSNATLKASAVFLGCTGSASSPANKTSAAGSNNVLHVTGPSSTVSFSYSWEDNKGVPYRPFGAGPYCAMVFEDGAQLKVSPAKGLSLVGTNCLVRVSGSGSKLEVSNNLTLPGENNRIEVSDGAALSCLTLRADYETVAGAGNEIVVSNASFSAQTVFLGAASAAASNNVLTLTGPSTSLTLSNLVAPYRPFGAGRGCAIRFEDGAQFSSTVGEMDLCGTNCLFRVSGTNEVAQKNSYFDVRNFDISGKGNTVEVSDGGKLRCYICHTYSESGGRDGTDNTIIVSNGTFSTYQYWGLFIKGESNKLVLQGDSPRVESTCGANFYLYNGAKLVFELPLGKTEYVRPPLSFNYMHVTDGERGDAEGTGADPEILFPNLEEYQKSIDRTANLQIGKCHTGARMKQVIRNTNAKLPKGCKLTAEEWGDNIILQVKPIRGMLLIVR